MIRALVAIAILAHTARAESIVAVEPVRDGWSLLGTRVGYGSVPVGGAQLTTMSLAVTLDRPLAGAWRVLAEYEYVWIGPRDVEAHVMDGVSSLPDSGHRVHAGVRRRIAATAWRAGAVSVFADGEAGLGAMLADRSAGAIAVPHGFAGVRAGFALEQGERRWEYELVLRGLALPDGAGVLLGIALVWGE